MKINNNIVSHLSIKPEKKLKRIASDSLKFGGNISIFNKRKKEEI